MKDISVLDVADYFRSKDSMTHKKLQKLVYYAYAWYIALYNEDADNINNRLCCDGEFQAWVHGPVCRKLYNKFSNNYGYVDKYDGEISSKINEELKKYLDVVYGVFGKYDGDELESMTHKENPWLNARKNVKAYQPSIEKISEKDMFIYYNSLNA